MKTTKLGAMFLISIMALAGIGAGYAVWADTVNIYGQINTGEVRIGVRHLSTSDPGQTLDPRRELFQGGPSITPDYHAATTTGTNGAAKCTDGGATFYYSVSYLYDDVYPGYAPTVKHEICNCGTLPVKLTFSGTFSGNPLIASYMDIVEWKIWLDGHCIGTGDDADSLDLALDGYVLDNGHRLAIQEEVHFWDTNLPENDWVAWTITVTGTQWNG